MSSSNGEQTGSVGVIGGSGFVGRAASAELARGGWRVVGFSRDPGRAAVAPVSEWRASADLDLSGLDAVVNLAGEPIDRRWTDANRRRFHASRVGLTRRLVAALAGLAAEARPRVLVNASAIGIYGDRGDESLEESASRGGGYLAELCGEWEDAAAEAGQAGVRVVTLRIGVVLGRGGPAFERMRRVFALGLGGKFGSGRQWMSWIHVADLARMIAAAVADERWRGPLNGTAPHPERNADFTAKLAAALGRPALFAVPGLALKTLLGGFGEVLLASQRVVPAAASAGGFEFAWPRLEEALADLVGGDAGASEAG